MAFHLHKNAIVPEDVVPIFYAVAMIAGGLASLIVGRLLDKIGLPALLLAFFLASFSAPLVFLGNAALVLVGVILWGIGLGTQDSSLKALLAGVVPPEKRSTAFGVFDTGFGIAWFLGSSAMGLLYETSVWTLVVLSIVLQLLALPIFFLAKRHEHH
jgi:predicted MFS family arabinose efflux permease